ncbi:unnamed protein product [Discosporangium mesarthrocarpum]
MWRFSLHVLIALLYGVKASESNQPYAAALDLLVKHHGGDILARTKSVTALVEIVDNLRKHPGDGRYRRIRLLNKGFWEKIGSVNGGIAFMTALGFELVDEGTGQGPLFVMQSGESKVELESVRALLSAELGSPPSSPEKGEDGIISSSIAGTGAGFNPFSTSFSRKSETHLQEIVEANLDELTKMQASIRQDFKAIGDRNVTFLLPHMARDAVNGPGELAGRNEDGDEEEADDTDTLAAEEMEVILRVWREGQNKSEKERFETTAARELRRLRGTKFYPYVLVRVRMPSGIYLQARFGVDESCEDIYRVIASVLDDESRAMNEDSPEVCGDFELFMAPPMRALLRNTTSLRDSGLVPPASIIHLRWGTDRKGKGKELEEILSRPSVSMPYRRVEYSPRYDFPEPKSVHQLRKELFHEGGDFQ